jgi:hypothetical protein
MGGEEEEKDTPSRQVSPIKNPQQEKGKAVGFCD